MSVQSAYRYGYFPSSGAAGITVAPDSFWTDTSLADAVLGAWDSPSGTAFVTLDKTWSWAGIIGQTDKVLLRRYILPAFGSMGFQSPAFGPALIPGATPTGMPINPIARMKLVSVTRGGSPVAVGQYSIQTRYVVKVVTATGTDRWVILRSATGDTPPATLTAKRYVVGGYVDETSLPSSTDRLVIEVGFALTNQNNLGSAVSFEAQVEFGDSKSSYLAWGSTTQNNAGFCLGYHITSSASGGGWTFIKPNVATIGAKRMQSAPAPIVDSGNLNEFLLN